MIRLVAATREDAQGFQNTALGISSRRLDRSEILSTTTLNNKDGLPVVYNRAIRFAEPFDILVFVHDDVWLEDLFLAVRIKQGLQKYDIIGLAGNTRKEPLPASAWHCDIRGNWDAGHLSGAVAHGPHPVSPVNYFGDVPHSCCLLDGLFIAAKASTLQKADLTFDEQFSFHFYDLDFCRQAKRKSLTLGTWPISVTHCSGGVYGTAWEAGRQLYVAKWFAK